MAPRSAPALQFINDLIGDLATQVTYDPVKNTGNVIYNLSLIPEEDLETSIRVFRQAHRSGISVSNRVRFLAAGEPLDSFTVPPDTAGICTLCTITLDGLLLRRGVPLHSIGGGLVEVEDRMPKRFTHMILYEATTIDPLEVLVAQELTSICRMMQEGRGTILGNIRECHMEAEAQVGGLLDDLGQHGFTGILDVGAPNVPLLGVPVSPQYFGIAMVGGTNPMAALKERGVRVVTKALKGLMDIRQMGYIQDY
ncbi:MAG: DUF128 domain-containing protein [Methanomicrobiales archaeon]|nr:DUF128 domain-containing protein [Methanomicrobiales archaeon]